MLAVCGGDGIAIYANAFGGAPTYRIAGHSAPVKGVAFFPGKRLLASVSADTTIKLWDLENAEPSLLRTLYGHENSVDAVAISHDGKRIASASAD